MKKPVLLALLLFCGALAASPQGSQLASPFSNSVFPAQMFTGPMTGQPIQLNGLVVPSTVGSSFASGVITVTGSSLSSVIFSVQGSSDNGATYYPLLVAPVTSPSATSTSVTATSAGQYQISLASLTHVRFVIGTPFTATSASFVLTANPNAQISRSSSSGGGAVASVFGRTGAVVPAANDYSFAQLGGSLTPSQVAAAGTLSNGTTGTAANATAVDGVALTGTPSAGAVPVASNGTTAPWRQLTQDDILPGFTITGFNGGSTVEIGATVTNPAFTASYSSLPTSVNITNTDGIGSPLTLTTPFTSGTVTGAFTKTSASSTTFTLNATQAITRTATASIIWLPRTFGGVGAAGASSSVTASGTNAVLSNGATLTGAGLSSSQVGLTYGAFTPSSQKIYLLLIGGSHTFKDAVTGFAFPFNSPTSVSFVNANGATVAMFLYESTNTLSGTYSIQVVS